MRAFDDVGHLAEEADAAALGRGQDEICSSAYRIQEIGEQQQALVFGRIRSLYIDDEVVQRDEKGRLKVDADRLDPLGRLGANEYLCRGRVARIERPA